MADRWTLRGLEYSNCNCAIGCPCQFGSPTTYGHCEAFAAGVIDEGRFNDTHLDGLRWALLVQWPGEIADGNGRWQAILDERGDVAQREALRKIVHGESTKPGATHFFVFRSTMTQVFEPLYAPIELSIDVPGRHAHVRIPGVVESEGAPIINSHSGDQHRVQIHLPNGFEYTMAEVGIGRTRARGDIEMTLEGSHVHFNLLHMNQDGVIR